MGSGECGLFRRRTSYIAPPKSDWVFSVHDNGIGIDPQYHEEIFRAFRRLHTRRVYQGNGIGLAISKKIVERHGGRMWVESQEGAGATFYFTLPHSNAHGAARRFKRGRSILSGAAGFWLRSRRMRPVASAPASFDCVPAQKPPGLRSGCLRS